MSGPSGIDTRSPRAVRIMQDPEVSGDLLLVALGFALYVDFLGVKVIKSSELAKHLWPDRSKDEQWWKLRRVFEDDARTYKPPRVKWERRCDSPMIRRDGPCGQRATTWRYLTDWSTGEKSLLCACSRHSDWFREQELANRAAKPNEVPLPAANHGGLMARYFPEYDWPAYWKKLDPRWVEHPEAKPWPKPTLTLVLGDGEYGEPADRPKLVRVRDEE